jgi:hypothetical protein
VQDAYKLLTELADVRIRRRAVRRSEYLPSLPGATLLLRHGLKRTRGNLALKPSVEVMSYYIEGYRCPIIYSLPNKPRNVERRSQY